MTMDWTLPDRHERYVFERLDVNLQQVGALAGVLSCDLDWSIYNDIRGSGDLSVRTTRRIEWAHTLVRPWIVVENRTGRVATPLGTYLCEVPEEEWTPAGVQVQVQLHDRTMILDQWLLAEDYTLPVGTVITTAIRAIFTALGIAQVNITDSAATLSEAKVWIASETVSWLRVLNDLCDLLNYFAVWADPRGAFQVQPYVPPASRAAAWRLADDGASNRYKGLKVSTGRPIPTNQWTYWSKAVEASEGVAAVEPIDYTATNDDPDHPFSTINLGRVVSAPPKVDVEGDVGSLVERAKAEGMADQRTFTLGARYLPIVEHEVAELVNEGAEVSALASLSGRSLSCVPGALLSLTLRKVA